ncbi:MAG: tRNA (5-methylaminomethyl-2-thiouridine)(34)-methyltransferase MnmD [Maribacter sp.]|nr:tRNA (5-methylaminomethyl-2-thiouridine)(34)-methyltransferase MnmD [Maribacter sp.]
MRREIITTADGSKTIHLKDWDEQYHSKHGAIQEAYHVFIKNGLALFENRHLAILEIGFGTGLNALITLLEAPKYKLDIEYLAIERYPVTLEELAQLNYISILRAEEVSTDFERMHSSPWNLDIAITERFKLKKQLIEFQDLRYVESHDLVYFDAFGARVQPELWTEEMFARMYTALRVNGVLVTYAAKGSVRRAMQTVGFRVERLPGPPGKREMLRAIKI